MIAPSLDILFKSWCGERGCDPAKVRTRDRQTTKFRVLDAFQDRGPLYLPFQGQTAFVYLIESNEIGGSSVPPIISVESSNMSDVYEEWFPGLPPLSFVNPIFVCDEFFRINVDNKLVPGVSLGGVIELWAHYLLAFPPPKDEREDIELV